MKGFVADGESEADIDKRVREFEKTSDMIELIDRLVVWSYSRIDEETGGVDYFKDTILPSAISIVDYVNKGVSDE